jgi:peptidoglycan hydrolase-like protein with peptidoglycan-binding domain
MNPKAHRTTVIVIALLSFGAAAQDAEIVSRSTRHTDLIKQVQEKLKALDFDAGPVNGDAGGKTQAALARFQLSRSLPASGMLDARTLAELGVEIDAPASAGASAAPVVKP